MVTQVKVCSHGEIVQVGAFPDDRVWHCDSNTWCNDRPETLRTVPAQVIALTADQPQRGRY